MKYPTKIYLTNERVPYRVISFENNIAFCERRGGRKLIIIIINFNNNTTTKDNIVSPLDIKKVIFNSKL